MRLGIMAYLARSQVAEINELKKVLGATQGNLSVHLSKLEDAKYVRIVKGYLGRKPRTRIHLTPKGRKALDNYLTQLNELLQ